MISAPKVIKGRGNAIDPHPKYALSAKKTPKGAKMSSRGP